MSGPFFIVMSKKIYGFILGLMLLSVSAAYAQYKAIITNLNNKKEYELKLNDVFYFGITQSDEKLQGTLESIAADGLKISGKLYKISEIAWIDHTGNKPKKHNTQIAKILFYFGGGLIGVGAYEYYQANDKKTATVTGALGTALTFGALGFWILPKQPQYDFSTKFLLEIIAINQETK